MKKMMMIVALLVAGAASPALAQRTPANNGLNQLNSGGTLGAAPSVGGPSPSYCGPNSLQPDCQQAQIPDDQARAGIPNDQKTITGTAPANVNRGNSSKDANGNGS